MIVDTEREYVAPGINVVLLKIGRIVCISAVDPFHDPDPEEIW